MNTRMVEFRPPRIAMLLCGLAIAAHLVTPLGSAPLFSSHTMAAGLGLAGFVVMIQAWWQFRTEQIAICPTERSDHLITGGIYRVTRNPMYLGMTMMLVGVAVWLGTVPFYAAAGVFFVIMNFAFCRFEEAKLHAAFGRAYEQYAAQVRRWL